MNTPSDAAGPVAWLDLSKMTTSGMAYATGFKVNEKQTALYTAADYDALREESERLREHRDSLNRTARQFLMRAEAGEAKLARAAANLKFALEDRVNGQITYAGVCALQNALAALNEGEVK